MLLAVMLFLYYLLAKDEERRMLRHYGEAYQQYLVHTGMFIPRVSKRPAPVRPLTMQTAFLVLAASISGAAIVGFGLRAYTVAHLPLEHMSGIDVIAIMPEDLPLAKELIPAVRKNSLASQRLRSMESGPHARILAYVLPVDYVMQGMIADTGQEWKLFGRHQTIRMITDYIFHPFAHLHGGHIHQAGITAQQETGVYDSSLMRRIIFLEIHADHSLATPYADFAINNERTPRFFVDVHIHTHEVVRLKDTPTGSGWGDVPTPIF